MIERCPHVEMLKSPCLVHDENDVKDVAAVLYDHYKAKLAEKNHILLLMGHGNPDVNYNANSNYSETGNGRSFAAIGS